MQMRMSFLYVFILIQLCVVSYTLAAEQDGPHSSTSVLPGIKEAQASTHLSAVDGDTTTTALHEILPTNSNPDFMRRGSGAPSQLDHAPDYPHGGGIPPQEASEFFRTGPRRGPKDDDALGPSGRRQRGNAQRAGMRHVDEVKLNRGSPDTGRSATTSEFLQLSLSDHGLSSSPDAHKAATRGGKSPRRSKAITEGAHGGATAPASEHPESTRGNPHWPADHPFAPPPDGTLTATHETGGMQQSQGPHLSFFFPTNPGATHPGHHELGPPMLQMSPEQSHALPFGFHESNLLADIANVMHEDSHGASPFSERFNKRLNMAAPPEEPMMSNRTADHVITDTMTSHTVMNGTVTSNHTDNGADLSKTHALRLPGIHGDHSITDVTTQHSGITFDFTQNGSALGGQLDELLRRAPDMNSTLNVLQIDQLHHTTSENQTVGVSSYTPRARGRNRDIGANRGLPPQMTGHDTSEWPNDAPAVNAEVNAGLGVTKSEEKANTSGATSEGTPGSPGLLFPPTPVGVTDWPPHQTLPPAELATTSPVALTTSTGRALSAVGLHDATTSRHLARLTMDMTSHSSNTVTSHTSSAVTLCATIIHHVILIGLLTIRQM